MHPRYFYLCVDLNNDHIHAIKVQPNNQLAIRVRAMFVLSWPDWRAKYAGIKMTIASNTSAIMYFTITFIF